MNALDQLRALTVVVADTGELDAVRTYQPQDATTNPSLVLKALSDDRYAHLLESVLHARHTSVSELATRAAVRLGCEILTLIPGQVSTEVDARLSFDTAATLRQARQIIALYEQAGISRDRVLIKIGGTWEGIEAARLLEQDGIRCNVTLVFSLMQAVACAEAQVTLISPFVGRITDWHKARGLTIEHAGDDPGVQSVQQIHRYFRAHGHATIVMGASFRNTGQIRALAGCDRLTISPALLGELAHDTEALPRMLHATSEGERPPRIQVDARRFRWALNDNAMACEKLAEGIRLFTVDQEKLEARIAGKRGT